MNEVYSYFVAHSDETFQGSSLNSSTLKTSKNVKMCHSRDPAPLFGKLALITGSAIIICGLCLQIFWNDILKHAVHKELLLSTSSKSYSVWAESTFPVYIDFYFFNWTNPGNASRPGYKPEFQEVGPFRFREFVKKVNVKWNDNGTVTYRKRKTWHFEREGSHGGLDEAITTLNVIALTAAKTTSNWNRVARMPLALTLSSTQKIETTKTVGQFLFEGYSDPLMDFASKMPGLASQVPFDRFGWFYKRNGTSDFEGVFNIETGENGADVLGSIRFWNYRNRTSFYEQQCGVVSGSAGDFWPPDASTTDDIMLFSPDMCRYISFSYEREETVEGVKGFRYDSGPNLFDNGTIDPNNKCFCVRECVPSGTIDVSRCRSGAPAFVSYPHFHLADPSYLNSVSGLKPDPRKHETYIILEQNWRIPLQVTIRLQINLLLEPDPAIRLYRDVPKVFFPMIWFEQKVTLPEHMRSQMKLLAELPEIGRIVAISLYCVGFLCVLAAVFVRVCVIR